MGPPLCAERDSVLLMTLPGNHDVTEVHSKDMNGCVYLRVCTGGGEVKLHMIESRAKPDNLN